MLPPEINSGRLYSGPGSGPMLAAADAWDTMAAELYSASSSYQSVVSGLTAGSWLGPSSVTMAAAAAAYATWLSSTAAQAQETAGQATAAAAAYETAFAATVPPEVVAANRSLLMTLIATNLLGQNTAAIAATEAQYAEMWAQDVGAMFGYAGTSASATQVTPFSSPAQTTNSTGLAAQSAAVGQAGGTSAGDAQTTLSQVFSAVPDALSSLATSNVAGTSLSPLDLLDVGADLIAYVVDAPMSPLGAVSLPIDLIGAQTGLHTDDIVSGFAAAGSMFASAAAPTAPLAAAAAPVAASAALAQADWVGALSVPPTWIPATPAVRPIALALPAVSADADVTGLSNTFGDMVLANAAGRVVGDTVAARGRGTANAAPRQRQTAAAAARVGGAAVQDTTPSDEDEPRVVVTGIAAEIREFARLRDEGLIDEEHFIEQRNRLLGR